MSPDEIAEVLQDRRRMTSLGKTRSVVEWAKVQTPFLPEDAPLRIRLVAIRDGLTGLPGCEVCGEPVTWDKSRPDRFLRFCSHPCSLRRPQIPEEVLEKLRDRDWLHEQRITRRKSKERIATDLGVSITPVQKWLDRHGIPDVRFNESAPLTRSFLRDRDWLHQQHVVLRRTLEEIATEIGSSGPTVGVWLARHGIIANAPNSYPRTPHPSRACLEIAEFIEELGHRVELDNRTILGGRELDIVVEDKKFAIEFNGLYSHVYRPDETSESRRKGPGYHLGKTVRCEEQGYRLLHVWEDDWTEKRLIVESMIRTRLGHSRKISARQCEVHETRDVSQRATFLDQNHIQGRAPCQIALSLVLQDEIVAIMTFSRARFTKTAEWELIRYASLRDHVVVGGFSKLLKHFRRSHPGSIISYADRGYSQGDVYRKNGFEVTQISPPNFWYVPPDFSRRRHRAAFTKARLGCKDDPRPEWEIMEERGWSRIFGPGTISFTLK